MQLFYTPDIESEIFDLPEDESKHCTKVLRKVEGDVIDMVDGKGFFYKAEILQVHKKHTKLKVVEKHAEEKIRDYRLHVAMAPTKNIDRFEWFIEKATEIGIDEITPLLCDHSERKVVKIEKLNKRIVSAMKQSLKATKPILNELTKCKDFINSCKAESLNIAHCYANDLKHIKTYIASEKDIIVMIGPEGDFSPEEVKLAVEKGFNEISLGKARLRTETAGLYAVNSLAVMKS
jgi:16S rRNA (uracil1498-N3)-methyltransferase